MGRLKPTSDALSVAAMVLVLGGAPAFVAAPAWAQTTDYQIPAGPLDLALNRYAAVSGVQVIYDSDLTAGLSSGGAAGALSEEDALSDVLAGSGLSYQFNGDGTVTISAAPPVGEDNGAFVTAPVVVTARRTEEVLQDVPASVFVLSGEDVERSNLRDTDDLSLLTPNVDFSGGDNPARIFFSIRGISDLNGASTGPTNGFFQDGVLQNNSGIVINNNRRLVDVDRVEVIYGPQGTAFGRGTIGGAINVVTNKPSNEFEASLRTQFASNPDGFGEAMVNIPFTDDLAVRAVVYGGLSDGFVDLPFGDTEDSIGSEEVGGRFSVRFTPTDRLTFDGSVQFDHTSVDSPTFAIESSVNNSNPAALNGTIDGLDINRLNLRGEVAYDFDFGTLRATSAYNDTEFTGGEDFDFSPPNNSLIIRDSTERVFSQELRFESEQFNLPPGLGTISTNLGFIYSDMT
ncbi:MAG: TonB-dependent receptor, partial [Pseudomonadota bacterium]